MICSSIDPARIHAPVTPAHCWQMPRGNVKASSMPLLQWGRPCACAVNRCCGIACRQGDIPFVGIVCGNDSIVVPWGLQLLRRLDWDSRERLSSAFRDMAREFAHSFWQLLRRPQACRSWYTRNVLYVIDIALRRSVAGRFMRCFVPCIQHTPR